MKTKPIINTKRRAYSLLELVVTTAMMATLVTSVSVVLRSSRVAWEAHASDLRLRESAHATLRHLIRKLRQATAVEAISASTDPAGALSARMTNNDLYVWAWSGNQVNFGVNTANTPLGPDISSLTFVGYKADGVTVTATPADVQVVRCIVKVQLDRDVNPEQTYSCRVWLRAW